MVALLAPARTAVQLSPLLGALLQEQPMRQLSSEPLQQADDQSSAGTPGAPSGGYLLAQRSWPALGSSPPVQPEPPESLAAHMVAEKTFIADPSTPRASAADRGPLLPATMQALDRRGLEEQQDPHRRPPRTQPRGYKELEQRMQELERANAELERRNDAEGKKFLEALITYESEVEQLASRNKQLMEERTEAEEKLRDQGDVGELRANNLRMERECQDMLQQLDEFEREKEEEVRLVHEDVARLTKQLEDQEKHFSRLLVQAQRERDNTLQAMTDEGQELQSRIEKLSRDKEALSHDLAKALARVDLAVAGGPDSARGAGAVAQPAPGLTEVYSQLRSVVGEREALKDEVTNKEGQIVLLRSQLEIADRKLRLTDMENAMLKSELEVLRRNMDAPGRGSAKVGAARALSPREINGHG